MKTRALSVRSSPEITENREECSQLSAQFPFSQARYRALWVGSLVLLVVIAGCGSGGGGGFNPNNVTVNIAPAAPTVAANGQVTLQVTVNGLCPTCATSTILWSITENGSTDCDWVDTPPTGPCLAGTIQLTGADPATSLTATYHAPGASGTYHVIAEALIALGFPTKKGTSVVTIL
jgi:hypothetical protein